MAQIVEYVNREGIQPTDRGTEARVQEGRRIGAAFNQVAESRRDFGNRAAQQIGGAIRDAGDAAVQQIEHRQINQGIDTYWQLRNQKENEWNDIIKGNPDKGILPADPHDPSVAQRFMTENLAPALQDWSDTFQTEGGQKFAQARVSSFLDHMSEKTTADMGTLAKVQIDTSLRAIGNTSSNIAYNDPSAVPHLMDDIRSSVEAMVNSSPNLKGADAARVKMELSEKYVQQAVKAGAVGAVSRSINPEATADQWTRDPRYTKYITGEEAKTLAGNARAQIRAQRAEEGYQRTLDKQDRQDRSDRAEDQILQNLYSDDPKQQRKVTRDAIVNNLDLVPEKKKMLVQLLEREQKPETNNRVSAATTVDLLRQLRNPNADLDKIMNSAWEARLKDPGLNGSLTERDFNTVRNEIIGRKTPEGADLARDHNEFFKQYARTIDPAMDTLGGHSQAGAQAMYLAEMDAKRQENVLRQKGLDPHELYDPRSQYFFGRPENLEKYRRSGSLQENMKERAATMKGEAPQYLTPPTFEPMGGGRPANFRERFGFDAAATVTSKADYDKLPSGTEFVSNGKRYRKP